MTVTHAPPQAIPDLAPFRTCALESFALAPLNRFRMNEFPETGLDAAVAVAGRTFSCVAVLRHRLPIRGLRLAIDGLDVAHARPVHNVIFAEEAALLPDRLGEPGEALDVGGNSTALFLLAIPVPAVSAPVEYRLAVRAGSDSHDGASLPLTLRAKPAPALSQGTLGKTVFWPHWETFCRHLGLELWSGDFWRSAERYLAEMAAGGMNVAMASVCDDPFRYPLPPRHHRYNHYPAMVAWTKRRDGSWAFDYTIYDHYVELNHRLGIDAEIECHAMLPCKGQAPVLTYHDAAAGRVVRQTTSVDAPEYQNAWREFLRDFLEHNRRRGWDRLLTLCPTDEPVDRDAFRQAAAIARAVAPNLRLTAAITVEQAATLEGAVDIATVHLENGFDAAKLERLKAGGAEIRWYNCCYPDWGNSLFCCSLAEVYRQGWITEAGDFSGFLRWAVVNWPESVDSHPGFNWPTGDTFLLYPGREGPVPSLRWHAYRQGLDDAKLARSNKAGRLLLSRYGGIGPLERAPSPGAIQQALYNAL